MNMWQTQAQRLNGSSPARRQRQARVSRSRRNLRAAFTVTELMVAVALMSLIVFALYSMFNQVQKALRANVSQVDSSERGRAVLELISKELEGARVSMQAEVTNLWLKPSDLTPMIQADAVPDPAALARTNAFDYIYYNTRFDKAWRGIAFLPLEPTNNAAGQTVLGPALGGMANLYRYETPDRPDDLRDYYRPTTNLYLRFFTNTIATIDPPSAAKKDAWPVATNLAQVAEGVVHFKLYAYDTRGERLSFVRTNVDSAYRIARRFPNGALDKLHSNVDDGFATNAVNVTLQKSNPFSILDSTVASFRSNALPAYLELELGVLEPDAMRRYNQMVKDGLNSQAKEYLKKRIANVQIFRKRIPLRSVAP